MQRFVGYDKEKEELDAKKLRSALFGGPVAVYMRMLSKEDEDRYKLQFAEYIKAGITADKVGVAPLAAFKYFVLHSWNHCTKECIKRFEKILHSQRRHLRLMVINHRRGKLRAYVLMVADFQSIETYSSIWVHAVWVDLCNFGL